MISIKGIVYLPLKIRNLSLPYHIQTYLECWSMNLRLIYQNYTLKLLQNCKDIYI